MQDAGSSVMEAPNLPSRNDGNNVSIDREASLLSENTLKFNLATQMVRGELKSVWSAIDEGRS
jgi:flagellar basal-body rod protein FlgB